MFAEFRVQVCGREISRRPGERRNPEVVKIERRTVKQQPSIITTIGGYGSPDVQLHI
jgi:hypothetical protein